MRSRTPESRYADAVNDLLSSWNDTPTRQTIESFVARVTDPAGPDFVPEHERVAVFDNDGTLWVEQPMPAQLHHILERLGAMVQADPSLRERQPWKAAVERDAAGGTSIVWTLAVVCRLVFLTESVRRSTVALRR